MSIDMLWYAVILAGLTAATWQLPDLWAGRSLERLTRTLGSIWPFGESMLRGTIRAMPAAIVGMWGIVVAAISGTLAVSQLSGGPQVVAVALYFIGGGLFAVCVICAVTITLFNVPRFVVPPALRHEHGTVRRWRRKAHDRAR